MDKNSLNRIIYKIIEKKSVFLVVVVVLLSFISAVILFGDFSSKALNYQKENKLKIEKIARIAEHEQTNQRLKDLVASLRKPIDTDKLLNQVEDYAVKNHIDIVRVSAKDAQKSSKSTSIGMSMSFKVKSFTDLVSFLEMIENSPYFLRVESWLGNVEDPQKGSMECDINVATTQIKI